MPDKGNRQGSIDSLVCCLLSESNPFGFTVALHFLAEPKGPADIFDNRGIKIQFLSAEIQMLLSIPNPIAMATPIEFLFAISDSEKALILRSAEAVDRHIGAEVFRKTDAAWYSPIGSWD